MRNIFARIRPVYSANHARICKTLISGIEAGSIEVGGFKFGYADQYDFSATQTRRDIREILISDSYNFLEPEAQVLGFPIPTC